MLTSFEGEQKRPCLLRRLEFVLRASLGVPIHFVPQRRLQQTPGAGSRKKGEHRRRQRQ